ncbi:hypothetical protein R6Q59_014375 [Mikania micrantha]
MGIAPFKNSKTVTIHSSFSTIREGNRALKDPWRSMSYVVRDVMVVFGLAAVAVYFNKMVVWPLYWIAQSTISGLYFFLGMMGRPRKKSSHFNLESDLFLPNERKDVSTSKEQSCLRGGLTTLDHDYAWSHNIHHDIGTHVIHHLFPQIPN